MRLSHKTITKTLKLTLTLCIAATLVACSSNGTGSADSNAVNAEGADSSNDLSIAKGDTIKVGDPYRKFATTAQAMDYMKNSGRWDHYSTGILPRMAEENLPYAEKLLNNSHGYFIVVDKGTMRILLYDKYGNKIKQYGMACARNFGQKHVKGDCRTPEGCFEAEGIYDSTNWPYISDSGWVSPAKGVYGKRFIRVKNPYTTHVGLHGTNAPGSIGHRVSHGCIRMHNEDNLDLVKYVEKGTPIIINPGPKDIAVNKKEGNNVTWITVDDDPIDLNKLPEVPDTKPATKSAESSVSSTSSATKDVEDVIEGQHATEGETQKAESAAPAETPAPKVETPAPKPEAPASKPATPTE